MEIHGDDHRNENQGIINEMQFRPGEPDLEDTGRNLTAKEVGSNNSLPLKQGMFDEMPDLDCEGDVPKCAGKTGETGPQEEQTDEHEDGITPMEQFGADQPGEPQPQHAAGFGAGPAENKYLVGLNDVFDPVGQNDGGVDIQSAFVGRPVEDIYKDLPGFPHRLDLGFG